MLRTLIVILLLCVLSAGDPFPAAADEPAQNTVHPDAGKLKVIKTVMLEDFESYTDDAKLAKAWYWPRHGGGVRQTIEKAQKSEGQQSLKWEYSTTVEEKTHYSPICRVAKWDASGTNAAQFWLKPDGSGRQITFQLNIANRAGKNIHDLWQTVYVPKKGDTQGRIVTIPFAALEHNIKFADSPDTSPVFKPEALLEIAFYINGRYDEPGDGTYYIDEIKAVQLAGLEKLRPATNPVKPAAPQGLIAAWNFDEAVGEQARDSSGNAHTGILRGAKHAAGRTGRAIECGKDALIEVPHVAALDDFQKGITIAAWVNRAADESWNTVVSREIKDGWSEYFGLAVAKNKALFSVDGDGAHYQNIKSDEDVPVGEWIHLAGTYDNATFKLYVNGRLVKSAAYTIPFKFADQNPLLIGGNTNTQGKQWLDFFHGRIDDVRLFNRGLSEKEITALFAGAPRKPR